MKTALVTGACGFVGSHMVEELLQRDDYKVRATEMESNLRETEDGYVGEEGEVWYLQDERNSWSMWKVKPETIEKNF